MCVSQDSPTATSGSAATSGGAELFGKPASPDPIDGEPLSPEEVKGLAAQLVEAQQLEMAAPDGLDPKVCNSKTHHKEWVAYDRKLTTQKALKLHPNLVEQFKDPSKKKQLFVDFYRVKGNLESLQLLVNVMVEMRQEAKLKYKKTF